MHRSDDKVLQWMHHRCVGMENVKTFCIAICNTLKSNDLYLPFMLHKRFWFHIMISEKKNIYIYIRLRRTFRNVRHIKRNIEPLPRKKSDCLLINNSAFSMYSANV